MHAPSPKRNLRTGVVEFRQYTLHPGMRDTLVALFEEHFIESQEACGMSVIGQFRDMDRLNRFVWLRGFASMEQRPSALSAFYDGPVWERHKDAANATMVDFDDVRLLKPAWARSDFTLDIARQSSDREGGALIQATIAHLTHEGRGAFPDLFRTFLEPVLVATGAKLLACLITESAPNNFPRLPVREGESAFVWLAGFPDPEAERRHRSELQLSVAWQDAMADAAPHLRAPPEVLRLAPTARSLLRG